MWGVKFLAHLPFPFYIALVISQPALGDSGPKTHLICPADLHIHATTCWQRNVSKLRPFYPGNTRTKSSIFLFHLDYCDSVCSSKVSESVSSPSELLQNAAAMIEGEMISAAATCEFQKWFVKILLSWLSLRCPRAVSQSLKSHARRSAVWDS